MKNFFLASFLLFSSISYSQNACPGLDSLNYSNQWYHTVQIGSQCWLKENLNVGTMKPAVKDQINNDTIEKFCYNNDSNMCNMYGGLYQWREAMQYTIKQGVRGICPIGWHIPLLSEFDTLISIVGGDGNALKQTGQGGGTNKSGFSGLLSGINSYTSFSNLGINADLWSCFSYYQANSDPYDGMYLEIWNDIDVISGRHYNADYGLSVRCIKDNHFLLQSPYGGESWKVNSNHRISWGGDLVGKKIKIEYSTDNGINWLHILDSIPADYGDFIWSIPNTPSASCKVRITDINDPNSNSISDKVFTIYSSCPGGSTIEHGGKIYNTLMIGNQCWFKENVNIGIMIPGSQEQIPNGILEKYCYNDDTTNCTIYGGLYTLSEMFENGICPTFWHIPTYSSFDTLFTDAIYDGNALKEVGEGTGYGAGTNTSGFSILLAGSRYSDGTFINLGNGAWFSYGDAFGGAFLFNATGGSIGVLDYYHNNQAGSVRCVRDDIGPLLLKSPVGGENWLIGSTQKIIWTLSNVINIRIDYTTDNGLNWINIIASTPTSNGSYNWNIPNASSINCKVRISSVNNPDTNSISNTFSIYQVSINPCPGIPTINYSGQTYNTIAIGDQCWMKENLNIGTLINVTLDQSNNSIIEKYCYNNDSIKCSIYGGLYQWDEAMQYTTGEAAKGICPIGWHIPTWNEFTILSTSISNNGYNLEEIGQGFGTNVSGFSALLAGTSYNGTFNFFNSDAFFWSSKPSYYFELISNDPTILGGPTDKKVGGSIRCINDLPISSLSVELTSFIASVTEEGVILNWSTATETNTSLFEIEKKSSNSEIWQVIVSVRASGNSNSTKKYSFTDKNNISGKFDYRLKIIDNNGSFKFSNVVNSEIKLPTKFELSNAYPNPCNPSTTICYQIPINIFVSIKVFNSLGREIATLVNGMIQAGRYEITFNGKGLSSGIYYYRLQTGKFIETKKFILIK
jgi:uncharacterized protein (TIGR02145 family)